MALAHILKKPIITEKSLARVGENQYTFNVDMNANKAQVAEAIAELFNVDVYDVKMMIRKGKLKRVLGKRKFSQTGKKKIAIVTIDPKQSIDLFDEFTPEEDSD